MVKVWLCNPDKSFLCAEFERTVTVGSGMVLVDFVRMAISQRDLALYRTAALGGRKLKGPQVLGNCAVFRVVDPSDTDLKVGQLVVSSPVEADVGPTGARFFMAENTGFEYAGTPPHDGYLQSSCILPAKNLVVLDDAIPPSHACLAEMLATAIHAVSRLALTPETRALILCESDPVGEIIARLIATKIESVTLCSMIEVPSASRQSNIIRRAVRISDLQREAENVEQFLPPTLIFDISNNPLSADAAVSLCEEDGTIVFVRLPGDGVSVDLGTVQDKGISVSLVFSCGDCFLDATDMLNAGEAPLAGIERSEYLFGNADEAFRESLVSPYDIRPIHIRGA